MDKSKQKKLLTELMEADEKDGLYRMDVVKEAEELREELIAVSTNYHDGYITHAEIIDCIDYLILQYTDKIYIMQRNRDRAVYSINRTKTSTEIRDAILKAPLLTDPPAICGAAKNNKL